MPAFEIGSIVHARGREWLVLPETGSETDLLVVRPLGGSEDEITGIYLPLEPVEAAGFAPPDPARDLGNHASAALLRDATRLALRSGAGPFRSLGHIAVDPRPYQIVPLLMALRLDPVRHSKAIREDDFNALFAQPPDPHAYCAVPLAEARASGCPLQASRPVELAERQAKRELRERQGAAAAAMEAAEHAVLRHDSNLRDAKRVTFAARQTQLAAATAAQTERDKLQTELGLLSGAKKAFEAARTNRERLADGLKRLPAIERDIVDSNTLQESLRREVEGRVTEFQRDYDYVVRALLGKDCEGVVHHAGRRLTLDMEEHGTRDSAALDTMKIIAFDLAALTHSVTGHGHHPRFLVHDGPREADLALRIFQAILLYAASA